MRNLFKVKNWDVASSKSSLTVCIRLKTKKGSIIGKLIHFTEEYNKSGVKTLQLKYIFYILLIH